MDKVTDILKNLSSKVNALIDSEFLMELVEYLGFDPVFLVKVLFTLGKEKKEELRSNFMKTCFIVVLFFQPEELI